VLSVVIPVRNGAATLADQLEALARAQAPAQGFEVIVADNGSTDSTRLVAQSYTTILPVRVVDAGSRPGINVARNGGIQAAIGDVVLLCDADDEVGPGWLTAMEHAFDAGHRLVAGQLDYRTLNDAAARAARGADRAGVIVLLEFLPTGHGANLGFTRAVYDVAGGFDERFAGGGDDVDFCWRAQLAGTPLHSEPDAVVHYRLRPDLRGVARQARAYGAAEALLFKKFGPYGLRRRPAASVGRDLWWLASRAPLAWSRARRGAWLRRAGTQVGRVEGALRHRVWWV
jgi:glycosyltransferase involved in cell wall biosynthesis